MYQQATYTPLPPNVVASGKYGAYYSATGGMSYSDPENGDAQLFPGVTAADNALRWGFIQKVYGILCFQMTLTAIVMFDERVQTYLFSHPAVFFVSLIVPLVGLIPLWCYRQQHPLNLILLGGWTVTMSIGVGMVCATYPSVIVLEALLLTAGITAGLTAYTFWATSQGKEFDFMGPWLFSCLFGLILFGVVAMFVPLGPVGGLIYALLGAVLFSAYIVYDTFELIKRYSVDEYVWASVGLYLDILNLFLRLLEILGMARSSN